VRKLAPQWTQGRLGNRVVFRFDAPARSSQIRIRFRGRGASVTSLVPRHSDYDGFPDRIDFEPF